MAQIALLAAALANQPDVLFPHYLQPAECGGQGCGSWLASPLWPTLFTDEEAARKAGSVCAIPGYATGKSAPATKDGPRDAWNGPFCFCANDAGAVTNTSGYCRNQNGIPEQINLQLAAHDAVVAAFVTFEGEKPTQPPQATFSDAAGGETLTVRGVTHWYQERNSTTPTGHHTGRNFTMHFVRLGPLKPRTNYTYKVKGGGKGAVWSTGYSFRSVYNYTASSAQPTRIGIFGDISVTRYNAVGNLAADCLDGRIDAFWVMGDHAYDFGCVCACSRVRVCAYASFARRADSH